MKAVAALLCLGSLSCVTKGERAATGECPDGQLCSPETPGGLYFLGSDFGDDALSFEPGIQVTALGGTQRIRVITGEEVDSPVFARPFAVASQGVVKVVSVEPPDVVVEGAFAGTDELRIFDPQTGLLFDQVELRVAAVAQWRPGPMTEDKLQTLFVYNVADEVQDFGADHWALYAGDKENVIVRLFGADGGRLVDTSMRLEAPGGQQVAWDLLSLQKPPAGAQIAVTVAGGRHVLALRIVDVVDDIQMAYGSGTLGVWEPTVFCFHAFNDREIVAGVPWSFTVTGAAKDERGYAKFGFMGGCTIVAGTSVGAAEIDVHAGNGFLAYPIQVVGASSRPASPSVPAPSARALAQPGARAKAATSAQW